MTKSRNWDGKKIIVYMLIYSEELLDDVLQNNTKLEWQIKSFERMGLDTWYLLYCKDGIYLCNKGDKIRIGKSVGGYRGFIHRHYMNLAFLKALKEFGPFDYAYVRKMVALPSFVSVLRSLHKMDTRIVVEIPTYSRSKINEDAHSGRWFRVLISPLLKTIEKYMAKYVDLYALIGEHEKELYGVPAINISNGMNALTIDDLPIRNHKRMEREYHLLALGHMREYHGIHRIIEGINEYYKRGGEEEVYLHVVGLDADGCLKRNKILANEYGIGNRVIFEGFKTGTDLNDICNKCDVAFCALAYYLKGGIIGNELKTRDYMSRGIPFVMSVPDEAISSSAKYVLNVPNSNEPIDICRTIDFIDSITDEKSLSDEMKSYALKHMTWIPELEKVLMKVDEKEELCSR